MLVKGSLLFLTVYIIDMMVTNIAAGAYWTSPMLVLCGATVTTLYDTLR